MLSPTDFHHCLTLIPCRLLEPRAKINYLRTAFFCRFGFSSGSWLIYLPVSIFNNSENKRGNHQIYGVPEQIHLEQVFYEIKIYVENGSFTVYHLSAYANLL